METETIDKLFLELSQVTKARTAREIESENARAYLGEISAAMSAKTISGAVAGVKDVIEAYRASEATLRELYEVAVNNLRNLMHYIEGKPGHVPLSGYALTIRDAILEKTERLKKLANAADTLWEEHKQFAINEHGLEGVDVHGCDSEGHAMMRTLVEETLAAVDRQNARAMAQVAPESPEK